MKQFLISFVILNAILIAVAVNYTGYKVYDVTITKAQKPLFEEWEFVSGIDFLNHGSTEVPARIMASPEIQENFVNFLKINKINHNVSIENVESVLRHDKIKRSIKFSAMDETDAPDFERYWSYPQMEVILKRLADTYPELVTLEVIGQSFEDRNIYGIKVSKNKEFGTNPIIYIDAGTHAREWAGIQSAFYFLHQLVENSELHAELLDKIDYVFVPVVNPDGYQFSFTEQRFWRKNRRYVNHTCIGVDLNRNYPYMWRYNPDSCNTDGHSGAHALSEPEIAANAAYMESFRGDLRLYLSTHTYGAMVLWPFGFDYIYIKNHKEHQTLGEKFAKAIEEATGTRFRVGNSADILYFANGASDDFAVSYAGANFAFTLELPRGGVLGFDYPEDKIHDLVKETFVGYRAMALFIKERFN